MKFFIDFDDVLFNTKLFKSDIIKIFENNGISEEIFNRYYKDGSEKKGDSKVRKYNPRKQIRKMKIAGIETEKIEKEVIGLLKNTKKYLFSDGIDFLKEFRQEELYAVSFGDAKFQKEKIESSGIKKYFKKILIVSFSKAIGIKKVLSRKNIKPGEALIFIDDREKFLKDIKKSYPGIVTFFMKRSEGRYDDERTKYCDFEVKNFDEILKIIRLC